MPAVRSLLARVQRLEHARVSPLQRLIGTPEQFAAECQTGMDEGRFDRRDMPDVVAAVLSWMRNGL